MRINKLYPDIFEIEDFVTPDQQNMVLSYCKNLEESEWWNEELSGHFFYGKQKLGQLPKVFNEIENKARTLFTKSLQVTPIALHRHTIGHAMGTHQDDYVKSTENYIRFGIVIYYNDDYTGGELEYPDLGIIHKPKARSLVLHGGEILHGTMPVTSDNYRYFSTSFVRANAEQPVVLNQELFD